MDKKIASSKIMVIDSSGACYLVGKVNEAKSHVKSLLSFINYKYKNLHIDSLTSGNARDNLVYLLTSFGNVVYLNDVHFGMFYFPNELSERQINSLYSLDMDDQKVAICYNLRQVGNLVNFRTIGIDNDYTLKGAILKYLEETKDKGNDYCGKYRRL